MNILNELFVSLFNVLMSTVPVRSYPAALILQMSAADLYTLRLIEDDQGF
jgi:hypothetical protein